MSELTSYSIQAIFLACIAVLVVSRSQKTDLYQLALISVWLVGVIAIFARYGQGQVLFYSNDQLFHSQIIEYYLPIEGFSMEGIIGLRYLLTVPVYIVSLTGMNAMLLNKFAQLLALLLIYHQARSYLKQRNVQIKVWHLPFIAGPLLVFMSLLSLRDVILASFSILFILNDSLRLKAFALICLTLLRPHLGVAMLVGLLIAECYQYLSPKLSIAKIIGTAVSSYVLGTLFYWIGAVIQKGVNFDRPQDVFTQASITRLLSNFTGLQFLTLRGNDEAVVAATNTTLIASRFIFFETLVIPMTFIYLVFRHVGQLTKRKMTVLTAFLFFYGIVSQTPYNSTRQNIPFLACMGVLAVADIEFFRNIKKRIGRTQQPVAIQ